MEQPAGGTTSRDTIPFVAKMALLPIVAIALIGLLALVGNRSLTSLVSETSLIVERNLDGSVRVSDIASRVQLINAKLYRLMTLQAAGAGGADVPGDFARVGADLEAYRRDFADQSQADRLDQALTELRNYQDAIIWVGSMLEIDFAAAVSFIQPFNQIVDQLTGLLGDVTAATVDDARTRSARAGDDARTVIQTSLWVAVGVSLAISLFAWVFGHYQQRLRFTAVTLEREVAERTRELVAAREEAERSYSELRATQDQLVVTEKMASLGQLTAGIAHEIRNPLNFINNFSALSVELLRELRDSLAPVFTRLEAEVREDAEEIADTLSGNLEKIRSHGDRANGIVESMLLHSRGGPGVQQATDLNKLVDQSLTLAYHGARAHEPEFDVTLELDLEPAVGTVALVPQDVTRVLHNLFSNGFYATQQRRRREPADAGYVPTLRVSTRRLADRVEIRVRDNGPGMPVAVREKLFTPFFTTKPAGQGTGLGLSLSHEIIVQRHRGGISVDTSEGEFTEFTVWLPVARSDPQA